MRKVIKNILLYINLVFAFFLVLAYVSSFISPRVIPWLPFYGLAYPYILAINVIFIGIWIRYRKWNFIISLLIILIGWNQLSALFQVNIYNKEKAISENQFSIMTYNVRLFDLYNWSHNKATKKKIFDFLRLEQPDIMCFQEFYYDKTNSFVTLDSIKKFKNVKEYHAEYTYEVYDKHHFGIATFSRFPIIYRGSLSFERTNNICIYSDIVIDYDTIRIYNNHLESIKFQPENYNFLDSLKFLSDEEHRIQGIVDIYRRIKSAYNRRAFQVEIISDHIRHSPYPVIVCGDFNDSPFSYTYRRMRGDLEDAFIESGNGIGNTYARLFPSYRIDYLLFSNVLESKAYQRFKVYYSDHFPIVGYFKFKH